MIWDVDSITVQVWGGPFDGEVYVMPGKPTTMYLAETVDLIDFTRGDPVDPCFNMWALPIKLDAQALRYPLKAWWDERSIYRS